MGGDAHPNERRAVTKANHVRKPLRCSTERMGWKGESIDCIQSEFLAFGIAGDRKAMALEAEVWVKTVGEGGREIMAAWGK